MVRLLRAFCMAALLAAATLAHAQISRPAAEELMRKSGLWEQLDGIGTQVELGVQQAIAEAGTEPADSEKARITRVVREAYAPARLRAVSAGVIAAKTKAANVPALRRWFDSPTGQAVTRVEEAEAGSQVDPSVAMREGVALLKSMSAERRQLLEDLQAATRAADALVQVTISTTVAVQLGAASALPGAPALSASEIREELEAQRPQLLQAYTAMTIASFARVYAQVSTEQLRQYVAFIRTPAGQQFNDVVIEAMDAALTDAAAQMGRRLPGTRDGKNT